MTATKTGSPHAVQSVERALGILTVFTADRPDLGLGEIAAAVGLPKSSTRRLLATMEQMGFIAQNRVTQRYRLGVRLFHLGTLVMQQMDLVNLAQPIMEDMRDECGESVTLHLRQGLEQVIVAKMEGRFQLRQHVAVGDKSELLYGASCKAILAWLPRAEVRDYLTTHWSRRLDVLPPGWIEQVEGQLEQGRRQGYLATVGERVPGVFSFSAPVFNFKGEIIASLSISGAAVRLSPDREPVLIRMVRDGAQKVSQQLGFEGSSLLQADIY